MTASERRRAIVEALYVRRHETISNFAFEFGVSRRTIEYDVLQLSLEYPIYTTKGTGGGVHVMDGCRLETSRLNETELLLLLKLSESLQGKDLETMNNIIKKFRNPKSGLHR